MERNNRNFEAVQIGLASVETGRDRFTKDDHYVGPRVSGWRCNLTALSQRYNLYFIAVQEGIAVYEPDFPFQRLKSASKLYIPPALANPDAHGYIDGRRPHCVNHLIVGELGTEEILLLATDSGNVTAYHTKSIHEAIQKDPFKFSADRRSDYVGLRPFFMHWVHESAWGLTIHREGRMIAVSANRPHHHQTSDTSAKITVFAFALTELNHGADTDSENEDSEDSDNEMEGDHDEWFDWNPSNHDGTSPTRDRNFKITLAGDDGHANNIPSISFVNTSEDPDGSWLISTDINGGMKTWQIWRGTCYMSYDFEETGIFRTWPWRRDGGWLVAALDPGAFRQAATMEQFCGHHRAPQYLGHVGESYDITNIARLRTPGRSHKHPLIEEQSEDEDDQPEIEEAADEWSSESMEAADRSEHSPFDFRHLSIQETPRLAIDTRHQPSHSSTQESSEEEHDSSVELQIHSIEHQTQIVTNDRDIEEILLDHYERAVLEDGSETGTEPEDEDMEDESEYLSEAEENVSEPSLSSSDSRVSRSSVTQRTSLDVEAAPELLASPNTSSDTSARSSRKASSTPSKRPHSARNGADPDNIRVPFIPTLHCSFSHLRLINVLRSRSPHVFCANVLNQELPPQLEAAHEYHLIRLSMLQQIPELGIIIVASQLGRVAICSLTRHPTTHTFGLRIDWVLPTRKQERSKMRPLPPLLGIATSPIQGRQFRESENAGESGAWANDRNIAGIETTFDRRVLLLSPDHSAVEDSDSDTTGGTKQHTSKRRKRKKSISSHESSSSSQASTRARAWVKPKRKEEWEAVESSRRYRLMMTYMDMTVLTYEIGRSVEREDVGSDDQAVR